jgi:hypothetical protein
MNTLKSLVAMNVFEVVPSFFLVMVTREIKYVAAGN